MSTPASRVLMTADAVGGVWVYATELARTLCRHGCEVTLVVLGPPPTPQQMEPLRGTRGLSLEITGLALEWTDPEGADISRARDQLARLERRIRPDTVHLNGFREARFAWSAPVLVAAHSCVWSWWRACRGEEILPPPWTVYIENVAAGLAASQAWVAPTAAFRDTIARLYAPPTHGLAIWNGVGDRLHATAKEPVILAAGRLWDPAKNVSALVDIAARLPWPVRIAGPLQQADAHDGPGAVPSGVQPLGALPRPDLLRQMQRASIFAAPALYEPFGLTVLEAARAGCALVLSDITSFRELWGGAALFVDPHDRAMLHAALAQLIRNEPLRRDLQQQAVRRARRYSLSGMCAAYLEVYAAMARKHASASYVPRGLPAEAHP